MAPIDNEDNIPSLEIILHKEAKANLDSSLLSIDRSHLNKVLHEFYWYRAAVYLKDKDYDSLQKLEVIEDLIAIANSLPPQ